MAAITASVRLATFNALRMAESKFSPMGLGKVEHAGDGAVAFALHHQGKHLQLPFGQTKIGGRGPF